MDDGDKLNTYVTVAVGTKIISIQASADQIDRTVYESFLRSLTLEGNRIFGGNVDQLANKRVQLDQLQTSPEIASALTVKDAKGDFVEARPLSEFVPEPESLNKPTRPVLVLRQPRKFLDLPPAGKFTGLLKAKVLFRSDGTIGTIELFSDIPKQMQRNVYKEIQKIKFLPAQISGQNVDHLKVIEYSFNSK